MISRGYIGAHCEGRLVYIGVDDRAVFDSIARPETDHRPKSQLLTKSVEQDACTVIFQHWIESVGEIKA